MEGTHADTEGTCERHTQIPRPGIEPKTVLLLPGNSADYTTVPQQYKKAELNRQVECRPFSSP